MRRALITGAGGFLGQALLRAAPSGWELHPVVRQASADAHAAELSDGAAVHDLWKRVSPDLVIHTAYSAHAPERDIWDATRNVVDASRAVGAELIHLSTDMVFDGDHAPYAEDSALSPILDYGRWKARAEEYVRKTMWDAAVVRTSLITSFAPLDPRSTWVAGGLRGESTVTLYTDEIRCPIVVDDLATQLWELARKAPCQRSGVWHLAGPEAVSRYALGLLIAAYLGLSADRLLPASSQESATPRPRDLRLLTTRADAELRTRARPISALAMDRPDRESTTVGEPA